MSNFSAQTRFVAADMQAALQQPSMLHNLPLDYEPDDAKPVAVLVCHGMGQQVAFETLASLADQLRSGSTGQQQQVRHVHFVDPDDAEQALWLPRAELNVNNPAQPESGGRTVHVYEAYWAPLAEGHISITEVIRFLSSAGLNGLGAATKPFRRRLFDGEPMFKIPFSTPFGLVFALLLIMSLVTINAVLTLVVGRNMLGGETAEQLPANLVNQLTLDLCCGMLVCGVAYAALWWSKRLSNRATSDGKPNSMSAAENRNRKRLRPFVNSLAWVLLVVATVALIATAVVTAARYAQLYVNWADFPEWPVHKLAAPSWARYAGIGLVWGLALGASWKLRGFFVQYLGDVTIYLDAYKIDRFHKVRDEIRTHAYRTACAIYGAREKGAGTKGFLYERVLVVGHSLGSVIAYDMLNATLKMDETLEGQLAVKERTQAFITFGSPLDKTAYIFHARVPKNSLRTALATSAQPLIRDGQVRASIEWINIYSSADPISGKLEFYDDPQVPQAWRVKNLPDPDARTPLIAHQQYWENATLANTIKQSIFKTKLAPAPAADQVPVPA